MNLGSDAQPVLGPQPLDPAELTQISGDNDQPPAARVARNQRVIATDALAATFQYDTDFGSVRSGGVIERQHLETCDKPLDFLTNVSRPV